MKGDVEEVKEKIVKAAMKVFAVHGFFKAPVNLIAKEAGVSKGLIFWYFRSKDELVLEVALRSLPIDPIRSCLGENIQGVDLLRCIGIKFLDKYSDPVQRNLLLHTMSAGSVYPQIQEAIREMCEAYVKEAARRVFGSDSIKFRIAIRTFLGSLQCYVLRPPPDIDKVDYLNELILLILRK